MRIIGGELTVEGSLYTTEHNAEILGTDEADGQIFFVNPPRQQDSIYQVTGGGFDFVYTGAALNPAMLMNAEPTVGGRDKAVFGYNPKYDKLGDDAKRNKRIERDNKQGLFNAPNYDFAGTHEMGHVLASLLPHSGSRNGRSPRAEGTRRRGLSPGEPALRAGCSAPRGAAMPRREQGKREQKNKARDGSSRNSVSC